MSTRIRDWLGETHGARFELMRHFLTRMFDSELVSTPGEWFRVAAAVVAILFSTSILLLQVLRFKYAELTRLGLSDQITSEARADQITLAALAVAATALLAGALWESLYPARRDYLALASLPIHPRDIFTAKLFAVAAVFSVFVLTLFAPGALVLGFATGGRAGFPASFALMTTASLTVFCALIALQWLLLNLFPARVFERLSVWMQALVVTVGLGSLGFLAWRAPVLFGDLQIPTSFVAVAPAAAAAIYFLSYRRHRRLLLESPVRIARRRRDFLGWLLGRLAVEPPEQAAFLFFRKTVARSRIHRLALLVYLGFGIALLATFAVDVLAVSGRRGILHDNLLAAGTSAFVLFTVLGLRYAFSLPAELRANWLFRITEREGRAAWLRAVERFTVLTGLAPAVLVGALVIAWARGIFVGIAWACVVYILGAILFEWLFRDWRKLPFTCSYLPGKRSPIVTVARGFVLLLVLLPVGVMVLVASSNPAAFVILLCAELAFWSWLRRARLAHWGKLPLEYEERPPAEVDDFDLSGEGTFVAQEQFARAWEDHLERGPDAPILSPLEPDETRVDRVIRWLKSAPGDLRYGARTLRRRPAFSAAAILTLGLGLGLNAAFFTVFNAFLLKPLAVNDPNSLVSIEFQAADDRTVHLTASEAAELNANVPALSSVITSSRLIGGLDGRPAKGALVSNNYFSVLGVRMTLGRPIQVDDATPVIVLSENAWRRSFGADENILGQRVTADGQPFVVIGVVSGEFAGLQLGGTDFWAPVDVWSRLPGLRQPSPHIAGRLAPGVSNRQASAALAAYGRSFYAVGESEPQIVRADVQPLAVPSTWNAARYFLPLLLAFALTMAIPCANAANMMLARVMERQRELGVRLSLGATRGRVVRQLLAEGFLIALFAGFTGIAVARVAVNLAVRLYTATAPPTILSLFDLPSLAVDVRLFCYMLVAATLTSAMFAFAPAAQATRVAISRTLRGGFTSIRSSRLRDTLVVGQVAVCAMLLVVAGLLLRTESRLAAVDFGYEARGVFGIGYNTSEHSLGMRADLEQEPWVENLAFMSGSPTNLNTSRVGTPAGDSLETAYYQDVSPAYFRLVRIPLRRGRTFTETEAVQGAPVALVTENLAGRLWPGQDPVGKSLRVESYRSQTDRDVQVVGVVGNVVTDPVEGRGRGVVYFPTTLRENLGMTVMVRGRGSPEETRRLLEGVLARRTNQGERVVSLQEAVDFVTYPQRAASWLSALLGGLALLLTITGVLGVMLFLVSQRTREIGIRAALGATPADVARFMLAYPMRLTAIGLCLGILLALGLAQYLATMVGGINAVDVAAYALGLAIVAMSTLVGALGPALRASRLVPSDAIRSE